MLLLMPAPPVSYSQQVAPVLALHCNSCHGDAGGLSTRTYGDLMKGGNLGPVVIAGDPQGSLLIQFIDGRRGEAHRMPLGGRPLSSEQIATLARWIADGAKEDADAAKPQTIRLRNVPFGRGKMVRISFRLRTQGYVTMAVRDPSDKRTLLTEVGAVKSPKDPSDAGAPGELISWDVRAARAWPKAVDLELTVRYAADDALQHTEFFAEPVTP